MTVAGLPAPGPNLRACVVVPAHDEDELIGGCLRALAAQTGLEPGAFEVILVLDACTDATAAIARGVAGELPSLRLHLRPGPGRGVGPARKLGMDLACARLLSLGRDGGLIASTDADSTVAPDWLRIQVDAVAAGARAIGGRIELFPADAAALHPAALERRVERAAARAARIPSAAGTDAAEHWQFSGASMSLAAATYSEIGGIDPIAALEDEALERSLERHGIKIERRWDVRVATSGRLRGRARRGLAHDLALDDWLARRTYETEASLDELLAVKDRTISVVVAARDVAARLGRLLDALEPARTTGLLDELLVVDAASTDGTPEVARRRDVPVVEASDVRPEFGLARGRGDVLWRGLGATHGQVVAFLDTGTATTCTARSVLALLAPLIRDPAVHFVKGFTRRPPPSSGAGPRPEAAAEASAAAEAEAEAEPEDDCGCVTDVLARPLISLHLPELAGFAQPLAGEVAGRRDLLESLSFPVGHGVEIAMLIDAYRAVGRDGLAQARLDPGEAGCRPAQAELGAIAYEILVAAERRIHGSDAVDRLAPGTLLQPGGRGVEPRTLGVDERPPLATIRPGLGRRDAPGR